VFNGYRLSFWEDERILAMVGGAGCAARWMLLMLLNYMVKMVNGVVCTFYYNKINTYIHPGKHIGPKQ
jgi:hypothetical protein